ncbi:MAG TPA: transcription antitermination factor NusB [Xanthomonadaceae bacterium]|nr:transcription antitermination factor NusB [Xanthomonadaceae bacterium]
MTHRPDGIDPAARTRARRRALQALYAWEMSGNSIASVLAQFAEERDANMADQDYFESVVRGVERECAALDAALGPHLDREMDSLDPIERALLRLAAFELCHRLDVPYRVVINEAVESAKKFGSEFGHTFVNGVLDQLAAAVRSIEYRA